MYDTCLVCAKGMIAVVVIGTVLVGAFWLATRIHAEDFLLVFLIACLYVAISIEEYSLVENRFQFHFRGKMKFLRASFMRIISAGFGFWRLVLPCIDQRLSAPERGRRRWLATPSDLRYRSRVCPCLSIRAAH